MAFRTATSFSTVVVLLACAAIIYLARAAWEIPTVLSPQGCRMSWMSPSYVLQPAFNTSWTPLAKRYSLWLYREAGWEDGNHLHGSPVLFIPGNAGSSHQVRSIAGSATRQFFSSPYDVSPTFRKLSLKPLDLYSVEFNEDLSALHPRTLESQSAYTRAAIEYILSRYEPGTKIILLGHSMGGIVSLLQLPSPQIKAIITMSTPHRLSPVRFDRKADFLYLSLLKAQMGDGVASLTPILSICGGATDSQVASETCPLPLEQGHSGYRKTVYTSALEGTWTGVGHREMVWCHQVRWRVARAALELGGAQTQQEMAQTLDRWFRSTPTTIPSNGAAEEVETRDAHSLKLGERLVLHSMKGHSTYNFPIPIHGSHRFTLLLSRGSIHGVSPEKTSPSTSKASISLCSRSNTIEHITCHPAAGRVRLLPNPLSNSSFPVPSEGVDEADGVVVFDADSEDLIGKAEWVAVDLEATDDSEWIIGGFDIADDFVSTVRTQELLTSRLTTSLPNWRGALRTEIRFPNLLQTPLLVYRLQVEQNPSCNGALFPPLLIHSSPFDGEAQYYPSHLNPILLHTHSGAPFLSDAPVYGLHLTIFSSGECDISELTISVAWKESLGRIGLRYWSSFVTWCIAALLISLGRSWALWDAGAPFPSVRESLSAMIATFTIPILLVLGGISLLNLPVDWLFGTAYQFYLVALTWILACGMVIISWHMLELSLWAGKFLTRSLKSSTDTDKPSSRQTMVSLAILLVLVVTFIPYQVAFLVAYLLHFVTSLNTPIASPNGSPSIAQSMQQDQHHMNQHHMNQHFLLLMTWLLPFVAPVLAVWLRTLATAGITTPFDGDHNILYIVFWLLYVEGAWNGRNFRRTGSKFARHMTNAVIYLIAGVAIILGGRRPWVVYETTTFLIATLVLGRARLR